jgi:ABC-type polysaccharide/polyol phosphate export permease
VLLPVPFWEVILSVILAQVLVSIPPLVVGLVMLFLVSSTINTLLLVAGLAVILVIYNSLGVLLGAKVRSMIKLNPLLVALMMITIIATPVYYRLLYVSEPYRTLLLLNPLTHVVVVLRASVGVYEGFPVEFSLLYSALISALLLFLTWWKLRGGAFTVLEKR